MKATFFERLGAYFLDMLAITVIFSIICLGLGNNTSDTEKEMQALDDKLMKEEISMEEYYKEYSNLLYDYQKENILQSGISVALTIAYYVVFQYMNKGQTIGKKLLKIQVVDKDTNKPIPIMKGLLRTFIILSILSGTLNILFLYIFNSNKYIISYSVILMIEAIFVLISTMFVLYRKDRRGLHDMISNTIVVKESR